MTPVDVAITVIVLAIVIALSAGAGLWYGRRKSRIVLDSSAARSDRVLAGLDLWSPALGGACPARAKVHSASSPGIPTWWCPELSGTAARTDPFAR